MLKTLLQKVKLLVMNNFSFCNDVFKIRLLLKFQKSSVFRKALNIPDKRKVVTFRIINENSADQAH